MFDTNPFPKDADRHEIWEILVRRDIEAFVAADWEAHEADFDRDAFFGVDAGFTPRPDHWRLRFPGIEPYREAWTGSAQNYRRLELEGTDVREFLYRVTALNDIDIHGERAVAHKKFCGTASKAGGGTLSLDWQTLYFLRKFDGRWKITGFVGYIAGAM